MPAGDGRAGLSSRQRVRIERATRQAQRASGVAYGVWVGTTDGDLRAHARTLLDAVDGPEGRAVVVAVDPARRRLEIVTSPAARRVLDDRSCALAAATMASAFAGGDLVGGIEQGLASLADHAVRFEVLHTDQP